MADIPTNQKFNFVSPGVFVNEIDNSQVPKQQVTERGPVVIGRTKRGPAFRSVRVSSYNDFKQIFGGTVPGGKGGDVWREGNETSPMYATYAAKGFLANSAPVTVVRTLGDQRSDAASAGLAGWKTSGSISTDTGTNGGAYGVFVMNSGSVGSETSGALAAKFYLNEGSMVLSGTRPDGTTTASAASMINSVGDKEFRAQIYDASDSLVEEKVFNFNRSSKKYIRKVFNTNPIKTNSSLIQSGSRKTYWLGETYERHMNSIVTSSTSGEHFGTVLGLEASDSSLSDNLGEGGNYQFGHQSAKTGWFFSQDLGPSGSFDARSQQNLFRFHSLKGGEWDSANVKITVENITAPVNQFDDYGSFDVVVRKASDNDGKPQVLERFTNCNLDPTSPDFIAKKIGNKRLTWNENDKRFHEFGVYDNQSRYIRVETHNDVQDGILNPELLPFGSYGPSRHKGFTFKSGSTDKFDLGDPHSTFGAAFAKGVGNIPKTSADSEFVETGGKDITGSLIFPEQPLRVTASNAATSDPRDADFGVDPHVSNTSNRFDPGYADYTRIMADDYKDKMHTEDKHVEYSWVFTLDDLSGSKDANTGNEAYWVSGSRQDGTSMTAIGSNGYQSVLDKGFDSFTVPLAGGFDGFDITEKDPLRNDAISNTTERDSYQTFTLQKSIDSVSNAEIVEHDIMVMPGIKKPHLTDYLLNTAKGRADTIAIIDLEDDFKPRHEGILTDSDQRGDTQTMVNTLNSRAIDNSYGAAYSPWVQIRDSENDALVWVPPSVVALGAMGYTEGNSELWFSPAGFNRGGLSDGNAGLPVVNVSRKLLQKQRDKLYKAGANPIADFPAEGIVIYGGKSLQEEASALDRINVRRLMNHIEKGISQIARTTLFEPNVQRTWDNFTGRAEPFLSSIASRFGLSNYKLKLDEETTTPDLIDRNTMYAKVIVKPTKSIDFIALDFVITNEGAAFEQ